MTFILSPWVHVGRKCPISPLDMVQGWRKWRGDLGLSPGKWEGRSKTSSKLPLTFLRSLVYRSQAPWVPPGMHICFALHLGNQVSLLCLFLPLAPLGGQIPFPPSNMSCGVLSELFSLVQSQFGVGTILECLLALWLSFGTRGWHGRKLQKQVSNLTLSLAPLPDSAWGIDEFPVKCFC